MKPKIAKNKLRIDNPLVIFPDTISITSLRSTVQFIVVASSGSSAAYPDTETTVYHPVDDDDDDDDDVTWDSSLGNCYEARIPHQPGVHRALLIDAPLRMLPGAGRFVLWLIFIWWIEFFFFQNIMLVSWVCRFIFCSLRFINCINIRFILIKLFVVDVVRIFFIEILFLEFSFINLDFFLTLLDLLQICDVIRLLFGWYYVTRIYEWRNNMEIFISLVLLKFHSNCVSVFFKLQAIYALFIHFYSPVCLLWFTKNRIVSKFVKPVKITSRIFKMTIFKIIDHQNKIRTFIFIVFIVKTRFTSYIVFLPYSKFTSAP